MLPESLFIWLESSLLSLWVRGETGATMAFPVIICFHAVGMGLLAGMASVFKLRVLGYGARVPPAALLAYMPVAWLGLVLNAASGLLLLVGYPTKALTNPVFYVKLLCIAGALWCLFRLRTLVLSAPATLVSPQPWRTLAGLGITLWAVAIVTGRLLAYTHTRLMST